MQPRNQGSEPSMQQRRRFNEARVDGVSHNVRYMEGGFGEPLVMLPGIAGLQITGAHHKLAERYRVIAFDVPKVREALASDDFLPLPSKFDINEYRIMERFCHQVADPAIRDNLVRAIHGSGAFGRFRTLAHHCSLIDEWHAFRDRALEDIAADWLEANGIGYNREEATKDES